MQNNKFNKCAAIILCGGKGTRLGSIGKKTNKTLIKYDNNPLIYYIIKYLQKYKIKNIILPLGYRHKDVKKYLDYKFNQKKIKSFNAGLSTSITDRIKKSLKFISNDIENILILNGDSFYKFNLNKLVDRKLLKKNIFINLMCTELKLDYGFVEKNNKKINFKYKEKKFQKFIDKNGKYNFFYSGLCVVEKNYLIKSLKTINDNFELMLFNKASRINKLGYIFDNSPFFQINYNFDLKLLKTKY